MKKFIAALATSVLVMSAAVAQTLPPPTVAAKAWTLLDATSGQVIASRDPNARIEPASLAKIMTAYVTFGALRDKKITLDQMVNVSVNAWKVDPTSSKMFIDPATPVSIKDLLYGLMIQSGNDAAVALAEAVAGDEATFAILMNREAERLGLKNTKFANAHGLPHPDNYTTVQDLATLAQRIIVDFPEFYKIDSIKEFTYNKITQQNRNRLPLKLFISVVTTGEVIAGIAKALREGATTKASSLEAWWAAVEHLYGPRILPFDGAAARAAGRLLDKARSIGQSPGWADVAIAGTAKAHGLTVLTRNLRHFEPLGVACLDPFRQLPPPP